MIMHNVPLNSYNTFGIQTSAKTLFSFTDPDQLQEYVIDHKHDNQNLVVLGGGSNILLTDPIEAIVIHPANRSISVIEETREEVLLRAEAGLVWDDLVHYALEHNYYGIENLSMIPGNCGAAPIQNIGAYGVELCEVFEKLDAVDLYSGELVSFSHSECEFSYRNSVFKNQAKGLYCITGIYLRLSKIPKLNLTYGAIQDTLDGMNVSSPTLHDVSRAVRDIRSSKLPDPEKTGNAGSFFKNPIIESGFYESLLKRWPEMPCYRISDEEVKIPAGWLIDQAGWKGYRYGNAAVHNRQALVLINLGNSTGREIMELARKIRQDIYDHFGIRLEPEVNIFDNHGENILL